MPKRRVPQLSLAALLFLSCRADAAGPPSVTCNRSGPNVVTRQADLSPTALAALRRQVPYKMADAGQPWNATDLVRDLELPFYRLICAYSDHDGFVVQYEYGGLARTAVRVVLR